MRRGKRILLTAVILGVICNGVFAEGRQEETEKEKLSIQIAALQGPSGLAAAKMVKDNFQPAKDVQAEYIVLASPLAAVSKMTSGEIDAAFLPVNTAAKLYNKGIQFRLAAISGLGSLYMVTTNPAVNDFESLKAKTIYLTGKGATPDYLLKYLLTENGINSETDVKLDFTSTPAQIVQLLAAGKADIAFIPQPFVMLAIEKAGAKIVIDPQKELMRLRNTDVAFPFTAFVLSERFIKAKPDAAYELVNALKESISWVNTNPSEASVVMEEMGILSATIAKPAIPLCAVEFLSAADSKSDVIDFLEMLIEIDPISVGGELPDDGFYFK